MILKLTELELAILLSSLKDDIKMSNPEYMQRLLDEMLIDVPTNEQPNLWQRRQMLECANDSRITAQLEQAKIVDKFLNFETIKKRPLNFTRQQLLEIIKYIELDINNHQPLTDNELKVTYAPIIKNQIDDALSEQNLPSLDEMDPIDAKQLFDHTMVDAIAKLKTTPAYNKALDTLMANSNLNTFISIEEKINKVLKKKQK